jgi:hypothetical protein
MGKRFYLILIVLLFGVASQAQSLWDVSHLAEVKGRLDSPFYGKVYQSLIRQADAVLDTEPLSVMMKNKTPASGDKHDYMSQARYFWPDTTKPDGHPYMERDGVTNPEIELLDRNRLGATADRIKLLALAWYFSGDEKYARKATELIRVWFLDKATAMNPNLEYAQVAPGHNNDKGRSYGLIDTYSFVEMLDGIALLENSVSFSDKDSKALRRWFARLTDWMLESDQGREEYNAANNHSVAYDAQIIAFSLFTGDRDRAARFIRDIPEKRVFRQIDPDGSQPHELQRTLAYHYSNYNIEHLIDILLMAGKLGVDIGNATSADGRNFYKAVDFMAARTGKDSAIWPYRQISGWNGAVQRFCKSLYRSANYLLADADTPENIRRRKRYEKIYRDHRVLDTDDLFNLVYFKADETDDTFVFAADQLALAAVDADEARKEEDNARHRRVVPRSIKPDGSLAMVHPHDWCSGFFAGSLWQLYDYTNRSADRQTAVYWTWPIEEAKWHKGTHDLGFMMNDSFGKALEHTGEQSYEDVVVQSAKTLISRYNPVVKSIRSWDHNSEVWKFPVIIDNMMNLELLFRATQLTGDSIYWDVAVNHANTTMKNHFRDDHSSFHVVDYDPATGRVRGRCTAQGYADDSFWSRGQGWGLYGFAMCYRFTGNKAYLKKSEDIADFYLSLPNMPIDMVPYWDMKMPGVTDRTPDDVNPEVPRDASAAAIVASGLYELSTYVSPEKGRRYVAAADRILESLHKHYQAEPGSNHGFILLHSTGHYPAGSEIDVPLNYADYYYLEALLRKREFPVI